MTSGSGIALERYLSTAHYRPARDLVAKTMTPRRRCGKLRRHMVDRHAIEIAIATGGPAT
jgi:tRNA(Ile)-lysidine synthase TilS/MesJ